MTTVGICVALGWVTWFVLVLENREERRGKETTAESDLIG